MPAPARSSLQLAWPHHAPVGQLLHRVVDVVLVREELLLLLLLPERVRVHPIQVAHEAIRRRSETLLLLLPSRLLDLGLDGRRELACWFEWLDCHEFVALEKFSAKFAGNF